MANGGARETGAPLLGRGLRDGDLGQLPSGRSRLPPAEVIALLVEAACDLDEIHDAEVAGRNAKPTESLAEVAYRLLVGAPYWQSESEHASSALAIVDTVPGGLPEPATVRASREGVTLPAAFDDWFAKAASSAPDDRRARASEQVEALARSLDVSLPSSKILAEPKYENEVAAQTVASPPLGFGASGSPTLESAVALAPVRAPGSSKRRLAIAGASVLVAVSVVIGTWAIVGYLKNDSFDDTTREVIETASHTAWSDAGGDAAKLDQLNALRYRLILVAYYPPRTHVYYTAFGSLGVARKPALEAAYHDALVEAFARPTRRLLEEKLRAAPTPELLWLYQALGATVLSADDTKLAAQRLLSLWLEEIRRSDASLALAPEAELSKRTQAHPGLYLHYVHVGAIKPEALDRTLLDRAKGGARRPASAP